MKEELLTDAEVFDYHGWRKQCKHITSEMHELTCAIYDYELSTEQATTLKSWNNICEEIADIEFMLNQIKEHYLIQPINVDGWKDYKRKRETRRIKDGYYEEGK